MDKFHNILVQLGSVFIVYSFNFRFNTLKAKSIFC